MNKIIKLVVYIVAAFTYISSMLFFTIAIKTVPEKGFGVAFLFFIFVATAFWCFPLYWLPLVFSYWDKKGLKLYDWIKRSVINVVAIIAITPLLSSAYLFTKAIVKYLSTGELF